MHLLDGRDKSDSATLQTLTWLPEPVWVLVWMAIGLVTMFVLFRRHVRLKAETSG